MGECTVLKLLHENIKMKGIEQRVSLGDSGGSRNFERGVQQVGWHIHSAPPKAVRRVAKWRSVRTKRGKKNLRVLFSDQEALS